MVRRVVRLLLAAACLPSLGAAQLEPSDDLEALLIENQEELVEADSRLWIGLELLDQVQVMAAYTGWPGSTYLGGLLEAARLEAERSGVAYPAIEAARRVHMQATERFLAELAARIEHTAQWPAGLGADPGARAAQLLEAIETDYRAAMSAHERPAHALQRASWLIAWTDGLEEPEAGLLDGSLQRVEEYFRLPLPAALEETGPVLTVEGLTGTWQDDRGARYRVRQVGNEVFWVMEDLPRVTNVFIGVLAGGVLAGEWADLPGGRLHESGALTLRVESLDRMSKAGESAAYDASVWSRVAN